MMVEQNEFLEIILSCDTSILRRPLVEPAGTTQPRTAVPATQPQSGRDESIVKSEESSSTATGRARARVCFLNDSKSDLI